MEQKPKTFLNKLLTYWFPVFLWSLAIFLVSNRTVPSSSEFFWTDFVIKKLAHIVEYAVLSILLYRAFLSTGLNKKKAGVLAIILAILYGISDEFHQSFIPGRQAKIRDIIFDGIGATIVIGYILDYLPKASKRIKHIAKELHLI